MNFYSILPLFVCMALLLLVAATPVFSKADTPPSPRPHRIQSIDGLRGFLAFAVLFHHAAIYHAFLLDGTWDLTPSRFYNFIGPAGVDVFFMITGYLFWARIIREDARPAWVALYVGRIFRIGPLYLVAMSVMLLVVFIREGFHLHGSASSLVYHTAKSLLGLGLFYPAPVVDGYPRADLLLAAVTWSLRWEWFFYLSLPITALVTRNRRMHLPCVLAALAVGLVLTARHAPVRSTVELATLFLLGMTCASLKERGFALRLPDRFASILLLVLLPAMFLFSEPYKVGPLLLLGCAFYLVVSGCTLFGLLVCRPARRLGDISYGIYLLQGLVLASVFRPHVLRSLALGSPWCHWALTLSASILLIGVATVTHVLVERPGIELGKRVYQFLKRRTGRLLVHA